MGEKDLIAVKVNVSLAEFLEAWDVTEILDELYSQVELQDDIKQWCKEVFGQEEDYYG